MVIEQPKISVILNAFKRTEYLEMQIEAINNQSLKVDKIYVWQNKGGVIPDKVKDKVVLCECSENLGVWARFAFALNLKTEYICLFDDDTIPGSKWLQNCYETSLTHSGLLGARGLKYLSKRSYEPYVDVGWKEPNSQVERVDIVGHCWFFKRDYLAHFWSELPPIDSTPTAGEDIHFSYMLQKFGLNTFVPPHPVDNIDMWGSLPEIGREAGGNSAAISKGVDSASKFDKVYSYYISKGFKLCLDRKERMSHGIVIGSDIRNNSMLRRLVSKSPILKKVGSFVVQSLRKFKIHV
ncbi:glycosyltransferase family 2 protein [Vibrio aestuarianus]|uniref:glycosyltransferase family 2 protein n=1 Tax=Vibrio aestuarianus TaxID=28171 RepID=UPI00237C5D86|nr:hypothetical protein [Vibrio aestuarianus]MDE1335103.1 glycosyltransferase family 2 protein [Vibrio aestuarianus]